MSAALKHVASTTTESAETPSATPLLDELLARVDVIEAKQSRPSPIHLRTWEEIERFAQKAANSGMVPKDYIGKPDAICIAIQMGSELGLAPMQALQNIAVVNGRPAVWGDALPALCRASGICVYIKEWHEGEGDALTYYCEAKRKGDPNPIRGQFSVADAKQAGLWQEKATVTKRGRDGTYEAPAGPWYSYRPRMLQMRARGFGLRDAFPDVLKGLVSVEEARDIPFEDTGLSPRLPEAARPAAPPSEPKRQTLSEWLTEVGSALADAQTADAVDAIVCGEKVQKALDTLKNGSLALLQERITEAQKRTAPATDPSLEGDAAFLDETTAPDPALPQAQALAAQFQKCATEAEIEALANNPKVKNDMKAWKTTKPDLWALLDTAAGSRRAELGAAG